MKSLGWFYYDNGVVQSRGGAVMGCNERALYSRNDGWRGEVEE